MELIQNSSYLRLLYPICDVLLKSELWVYALGMSWEEEASRILRAEVVRRGLTYKQLSVRLQFLSVFESERAIANKLSRGTFSFVFALQCCKALGIRSLDVSLSDEIGPEGPLSITEREVPQ